MFSSKYKLRWQDYSSAFGSLRAEKELCDIRLVSEDEELVPAHKVVLSTCSKFFKALLGKLPPGQNAVAYLGGVSTKHLQYVLEYIYLGEVNISNEDVDKFLEHAKKFKLQGFEGKKELFRPELLAKEESVETFENIQEDNDITKSVVDADINGVHGSDNRTLSESNKEEENSNETHEIDQPDLNDADNFNDNDINIDDILADDEDLTIDEDGESVDNDDSMLKDTKPDKMNCHLQLEEKISKFVQAKIKKTDKKMELKNKMNLQQIRQGDKIISSKELDLKLEGLIIREGNVFKCKECHQKQLVRGLLKRHAERHIKKLSVVCVICNHSCPTRSALYAHMKIKH